MKDLTFSGTGLDNDVVFRVDSISGEGNVTVMETYGLDDRRPQTVDKTKEIALRNTFLKLNYNVLDFVQFAITNTLTLSIADTDQSGKKLLAGQVLVVSAPVQSSTIADTTPTFSGTAFPGSDITIVVGGQTITTKAGISGAWTVDVPVALTSGAKSAVVTAKKDAVSASVTRAFTIS